MGLVTHVLIPGQPVGFKILKENTNLKERKIAEQNIVFSMKSLFAVKVQIHFLSGLLLKNI